MSEITIEDKKIISPKMRLSYPNFVTPKKFGDGAPKFHGTGLIPKTTKLLAPIMNKAGDQISIGIRTALQNAAEEAWGGKADAVIAKLKKAPKGWPIRDGDRDKPDQPEYAGHYFIIASAKEGNAPGLVGLDNKPIDPKQLYAGCFVRFEMIAYAYTNEFGKGCGFALQNVKKVGDGPKLTGKKDASAAFDCVSDDEDESEDPDNYESEESEDDGMGF